LLKNIEEPITVASMHPNALNTFTKNTLNIYLYNIATNVSYRNLILPYRNSQGELVKNPQIGLELRYLLTAFVKDQDEDLLLDQKVLASAIRILNENPILTSNIIDNAAKEFKLVSTDLADQKDSVRITFQPLSLEELTKIWSSFFQANYHTSVGYHATVIVLDSKLEPKSTLPVRDRLMYVHQTRHLVIKKIEPQELEWTPKAKITIFGQNLIGKNVKVQFDDLLPISVTDKMTEDRKIVIELPEKLSVGRWKRVQVIHPVLMGSPETDHRGYESNIATFVLAPRILRGSLPISVKKGSDLTFKFEPAILSDQKIEVLIGDLPALHMISTPVPGGGPTLVDSVTVKIPKEDPITKKDSFPTGKFLVRVRIDDEVESLLQIDQDVTSATFGEMVPKVEIIS
jgi:Pvc16 N-terminal domain